MDDDNDGRIDCVDSTCSGLLRCQSEICDNAIDDNSDGLVDCDDSHCFDFPDCLLSEICDNSIDDNGDGLVDCGDAQCSDFPGCDRVSDSTLRTEFCSTFPLQSVNCSDDNLRITFAASPPVSGEILQVTGDNVFRYSSFAVGRIVPMVVVMETSSARVAGWSIAVGHDVRFLSIADGGLIIENTDFRAAIGSFPFVVNKIVAGGFITAVVLDQPPLFFLPVKENTLIRANYTLDAEPPAVEGTLLELKNRELRVEGSPLVEITIVEGQTLIPDFLTHGRVVHDPAAEDCDNGQDDNGDGLVDCDDAQCFSLSSCVSRDFTRCDPNNDGKTDLADVIKIINDVFRSNGTPIECVPAYDCNGDSGIADALADIVFMLQYYFMGSGRPPPAPFPDCGPGEATERCENRECF